MKDKGSIKLNLPSIFSILDYDYYNLDIRQSSNITH